MLISDNSQVRKNYFLNKSVRLSDETIGKKTNRERVNLHAQTRLIDKTRKLDNLSEHSVHFKKSVQFNYMYYYDKLSIHRSDSAYSVSHCFIL